ncbi:PP2C family serine/threonine-protein phosphatase [Streptomyces sp. NBC_00658]|uniref:PP2C family serine/threonine-protein phosphatase n=1 Tax=Streptomyces sp. NBC_00658 TaxID=2975800 RepID=UPI00324A4422
MVTVPGAAEATGLSSGDHWRILCEHVMGPHKKNYQDCVYADLVPGQDAAVLAVADGHGSAAHAHSDVGARYAVEIFGRLGKEFAERALGSLPLPRLKADARDRMPRELVRCWQDEVLEHARRNATGPGPALPAPEGVRQQDLVPYGTTLIGAVITPGLLVGWQLGDGELAMVDPRGKIRLPLDSGRPELGDETDSLCSRQAWDLMRVHWSPITAADSSPALVLLSTDGLSKSFVDRQGYQDFVRGTYERLREQGPSAVADDLPKWLAQAAKYSGDDTTVAAAWRAAASPGGTAASPSATAASPSGTAESTWTGTEEE